MGEMVDCVKLGKQSEGLDFAPWPGELGKRIFREISKEAWQDWLRQQTILINEYKLNPLDAEHKSYLSSQMQSFLFGDGIVMPDEWKAKSQ
ncbi:MAG: oxidative damage protection protein [Gammaproteobacteria bacterium]|nr:oxidative damage protection protein [Gammaproteobacteria bacterium]